MMLNARKLWLTVTVMMSVVSAPAAVAATENTPHHRTAPYGGSQEFVGCQGGDVDTGTIVVPQHLPPAREYVCESGWDAATAGLTMNARVSNGNLAYAQMAWARAEFPPGAAKAAEAVATVRFDQARLTGAPSGGEVWVCLGVGYSEDDEPEWGYTCERPLTAEGTRDISGQQHRFAVQVAQMCCGVRQTDAVFVMIGAYVSASIGSSGGIELDATIDSISLER